MEKDIIYSKSFKSWFGDWENDPEHSSKVVDKNGKPLIMYHGTFQHFDTFDPSMGREATDIQGIYLTPDMEEASFYGNNVRAFYVNMRNPADSDEAFNIWHKYYIQGDRKAGVKARKDLQSMGYDGIMGDYDLEPDSEYVVFSANQVKSIDNNGNFSKKSDSIYENESNKTMNNYKQFFDKYTERTININNVAYQANLVNAVTSYLKNNGYQVTNNNIASGCQALIKNFSKNSTGISGNYGKNNTDTSKVNNALAEVFSPKQNTVQNVEQPTPTQTNPQGTENTNPQNTGNSNQGQPQQPQDPKDNGSKTSEDNPPKSDLPQDDLMNDLAGITVLTKDELRAMVNKGPLSKIMANLMKGKISTNFEGKKLKNPITFGKNLTKSVKDTADKVSSWAKDSVSKGIHPNIKISNIQIIGTDNIYDNEDNTNNKSRKSYNKQQNKSSKVKQGSQNGQVKA